MLRTHNLAIISNIMALLFLECNQHGRQPPPEKIQDLLYRIKNQCDQSKIVYFSTYEDAETLTQNWDADIFELYLKVSLK